MGIDKLKFSIAIKYFAFFAYLIYFYTFNSSLFSYIPSEKDGYSWCVDSTGNFKEILGNLKSDVCR